MLVVEPYKQLTAFLNKAQVMYIVPTCCNPIFWFFLKSMKAKYSASHQRSIPPRPVLYSWLCWRPFLDPLDCYACRVFVNRLVQDMQDPHRCKMVLHLHCCNVFAVCSTDQICVEFQHHGTFPLSKEMDIK